MADECQDPDCPEHAGDAHDHAEKLTNQLFLDRAVATMFVCVVKVSILPLTRTVVAVAGALMTHWSAFAVYVALFAWRTRRSWAPMRRTFIEGFGSGGADARAEEESMSHTEAADQIEQRLQMANAMPRQVTGWVLLAWTAYLCAAFGWYVTHNGGVAAMLYVVVIVSPLLNVWAARAAVAPTLALVRFIDPSRPRDTPEC